MTAIKVKRATIRDVAVGAQVSPATVSMVFNDSCPISQSVRDRVFSTAKTLDYRKTPPGRPVTSTTSVRTINKSLKNHKFALMLYSGAGASGFSNSVYEYVFNGLHNEFNAHHYDVLWQHADAKYLPQHSEFIAYINNQVMEDAVAHFGLPTVRMMGEINPVLPVDQVTYDNSHIGILAADWVIKHKFKYAAAIGAAENLYAQRIKTFAAACRNSGIEVYENTAHSFIALHDIRLLNKIYDEILSSINKPEVLFVSNDMITSVIYQMMLMRDVEPMRDILIVSVDNTRPMKLLNNPPVEIDLSSYEVGVQAARLLLYRQNKCDYSPIQIKIMPKLIEPLNL